MNVCRMTKSKKDGYKRVGDNYRVPGFTHSDTYDGTVRKALLPILGSDATSSSTNYSQYSLIIGCGRVVNQALQDGKQWTLGRYLDDLGGSKRVTIGVYIPQVSFFLLQKYHINASIRKRA